LGSSLRHATDPVFGKEYRKQLKPSKSTQALRTIQNLETKVFSYTSDNPALSYRRRVDENGTKGRCLFSIWQRHGVAAPHVRQSSDAELAVSEVPGRTVDKAVRTSERQRSLKALVDTVRKIRDIAYQKQNRHLFHLDMKLDNFIYDDESQTTYAIDPGIEMQPVGSLEHVDTGTHLQFLYHLDESSGDYAQSNLAYVSSRLPRDLKERMHNANKIGRAISGYHKLRRSAMNRINGESRDHLFTQERQKRINNALSRSHGEEWDWSPGYATETLDR
jgi:hypothetical protein